MEKLFKLPKEPKPDPFLIHEIRVTGAVQAADYSDWNPTPEEFFGDRLFAGWTDSVEYVVEIIHPDNCGQSEDADCFVQMQYDESGGLPEFLCAWAYPAYQQTFPWVTTYYVRGWTSKFDVPGEPIEYDAGIYVSTRKEDIL